MRIQLSIAQLIPGDTNFTNNSSGGSEPIKTSNPFYQATFNIQWSDSTDHYKYWGQQGHYNWYRDRHYTYNNNIDFRILAYDNYIRAGLYRYGTRS